MIVGTDLCMITCDSTKVQKRPLRVSVSVISHLQSALCPSAMLAAAATILPEELLAKVVKYVATNRWGEKLDWYHLKSVSCELKTCSLVCPDWANHCRYRLFESRRICLQAVSELRTLEQYTLRGCPRLRPLLPMVQGGSCCYADHLMSSHWS